MAQITEGELTEDGCDYGIRLRLKNGDALVVAHVDTDKHTVQRFLHRLIGEEVDSDQLHYLVEDLLQTIYDGTTP